MSDAALTSVSRLEESFPALYRDADVASLKAQRQFLIATAAALACSVVGAVAGALDPSWAGYVAAVAFVGALAASFALLRGNPEKLWYDGRAVAESVKTLAWQYAVGGGDFPRGSAVADPEDERVVDRRFVDALAAVRDGLGDVAPVPQGPVEQLTQPMRKLRASSLAARREAYVSGRIEDQADWYASKSRQNDRRRVQWSLASAVLQGIGLLGALGKAAELIDFDLLGIAAAGALAAGGWLRAKDHAELARAYAVAASELADVRVSLDAATTDPEWAVAVRDAESAISREHTTWAARRHLRLGGT